MNSVTQTPNRHQQAVSDPVMEVVNCLSQMSPVFHVEGNVRNICFEYLNIKTPLVFFHMRLLRSDSKYDFMSTSLQVVFLQLFVLENKTEILRKNIIFLQRRTRSTVELFQKHTRSAKRQFWIKFRRHSICLHFLFTHSSERRKHKPSLQSICKPLI